MFIKIKDFLVNIYNIRKISFEKNYEEYLRDNVYKLWINYNDSTIEVVLFESKDFKNIEEFKSYFYELFNENLNRKISKEVFEQLTDIKELIKKKKNY